MTQDRVFRKAWHHVLFQTDAVGPQWGMRLPVQRLHCVLSIMWSRHEAINPFFEEIPPFRFTKWWGVRHACRNVAGMHVLTDTSRCAGIWFLVFGRRVPRKVLWENVNVNISCLCIIQSCQRGNVLVMSIIQWIWRGVLEFIKDMSGIFKLENTVMV